MTIAAPPVFAEDKSSELEAGIHKLARSGAAFRACTVGCSVVQSRRPGGALRQMAWLQL